MNPKVSLIVLNWNNYNDTSECVISLLNSNYENKQIIIVDNASGDGSDRKLKEEFSQCDFIKINSNLGFAGGNNEGIKFALQGNADYIMLINDDVVVDPDFLSPLIETMEKDPEIGIVGPMILFYKNKKNIQTIGDKINMWLCKFPPIVFDIEDKGQFTENIKADYITGAGLMIRSSVIKKIGLMDDRYFLYVEEIDWCYRATKAGYKISGVPTAKIWHKVSMSLGEENPKKLYYQNRNKIYFMKKHANWYHWPTFLMYFFWKKVKDYFHYRKNEEHLKMIKQGIFDGFWMKKKEKDVPLREMSIPQDPLMTLGQAVGTFLSINKPNKVNGFYYKLGRIALYDILSQIIINKQNEILVPAFVCNTVTDVLDELNIAYNFYNIEDDLSIDYDDLVQKITETTQAVITVNYFGFSEDYAKIEELCKTNRLILIEDNSHGFRSFRSGKQLGEFGDISITSFYKSFAINEGAYLKINNQKIREKFQPRLRVITMMKTKEMKLVIKSILMYWKSKFGITLIDIFRKTKTNRPTSENSSAEQLQLNNFDISTFANKLVKSSNWNRIKKIRKENYQFWLDKSDFLEKNKCKIIFDQIEDGCAPLAFPIMTSNENFIKRLKVNQIAVFHWPGKDNLPKRIKDEEKFENIRRIAEQLYLLPVHQGVNTQRLRKKVERIIYV